MANQTDLDKDALLRQLGMPPLGLGSGGANKDASSFEGGPETRDVTDPLVGQTPGVSTTMPITTPGDVMRHNVSDMPTDPGLLLRPAAGQATSSGVDTMAGAKTPISGAKYTGFTPKYAMEGFNFGREQDPTKSAKDAFAMLANQAPPPPLNDKAALGEWFKQYIQPGMDQLGHKVSSVNGDTFSYANPEGAYTVDYGRGAGADGGALAWQAQDPTAGQGPTGAVGSFTAPQQQTLSDNGSTITGGNSALDQIMAEIQALQNGQPSQMDANALMQLLQGGQP